MTGSGLSWEDAALAAVRQINGQGRAAVPEEVLAALAAGGFSGEAPETVEDVAAAPVTIEAAAAFLDGRSELASFTSLAGGPAYHDPGMLSASYARIMDRKGSPLVMVAEEIRSNSRDYPRPLPIELFQGPPFDLSPEVLAEVLRSMAASPEYEDIAFVTTLSGAVHLFSSRHLDRAYAAFLAERAENLADNP